MGLGQAKVYLDVAGTDRSSIVLNVGGGPQRRLSAVGECDIVVSNAKGAYKSTFSEQQRVAVSAARAAFTANSDYFTGVDNAAPNVAKWSTSVDGGICVIYGNKLNTATTAAVVDKYGYAVTVSGYTPPYTMTFYARGTTATGYDINLRSSSYTWCLQNETTNWHLYTKQGGAFAERAASGAGYYAANTWYKIIITCTSTTSVRVYIYDVFGVLVWDSAAQTMDAVSNETILVGSKNMAASTVNTAYDSFLMWSATTAQGEQLFEGVIEKITYSSGAKGSTITLHCKDDARELEKQYDDTYGRTTATFTPTYGATDDISAIVSAALPSGWTYTCPDCAIHDKITFSIGTRRIQALREILDHTPYLGWFVLPMKHIAFVMVDTSPAPDAYTEAVGGSWTSTGAADTWHVTASYNIDGTNALAREAVAAGLGVSGAYYGPISISMANYRFLVLYYCHTANCSAPTVYLYTNTGVPKAYSMTLPNAYSALAGRGDMVHYMVRLPDASGTHGWTANNAPSYADPIIRILIEANITVIGNGFCFDVLYFPAAKKLTSKYTVTSVTEAARTRDCNQITRVMVKGTPTIVVVDDTTAQTIHGLNELLIDDQSITDAVAADSLARTNLSAEGWDDTADPIALMTVNLGDMYNVVPGDTLTVTVNDLNLTAATRTLIARTETIGPGWSTALLLSNETQADRITAMWEQAKRKRY